jgi:amino acid transporter
VDAAARIGPGLPAVMAAAAIISMLGSAAGLAFTNPRMIFALSRDGLMPGVLARLDPVRRTPNVAIAAHGTLVAALAISGEFRPLVVAASLASMTVYVLGCAAALVLRRRGVAEAGRVTEWRLTPVAAAVAVVANLAIILSASRAEIAALAAAATLFAGVATVRTWPGWGRRLT